MQSAGGGHSSQRSFSLRIDLLLFSGPPLLSKSSLLSESSLFTVDSPSSQEVLPLEQALLLPHSRVRPLHGDPHYGPQRYPRAVQLHSLTHGHRRLQALSHKPGPEPQGASNLSRLLNWGVRIRKRWREEGRKEGRCLCPEPQACLSMGGPWYSHSAEEGMGEEERGGSRGCETQS